MALMMSRKKSAGGLTEVTTQDVPNNGTLTITANVGDTVIVSGTSIADTSTTTVAFGTVTGGTVVDKMEQTVISGIIITATASIITIPITGGNYNRFIICK